MGFKVSKEGIEADDTKVAVIKEWLKPKTVQQMQQFLGLTVHLKGFIERYARICAPLTDLTSKQTKFPMNDKERAAFKQLKVAMSATTVMALPDLQKPFMVRTDASDSAIGVVLCSRKARTLVSFPGNSKGLRKIISPMTMSF